GLGAGGGPGRQRGDDLGAVERQAASRLGEGLVVADLHAHPADRGVERLVLRTDLVAEVFTERLVHLAVGAEDAVAVEGDRGVVAGVAVGLAEAEGDDQLARHGGHPPQLGAVERQGGRQVPQPALSGLLALRGAAEAGQIAAEAGLGQDQQVAAARAGLLDQGADGAIALLHVAAEFGGGDRDGGHDSPNPVTVPCTAVVVVPSGQRSRTPGSAVRTPQVADSAGPAGATAVPGRSAVSTAKPGKQVSHSATEAPAGRGTRAMSMSAPTPAASASIPVVPASPAMETSLAAAGAVRATKRPSSRSSSP